MPVTSPDNIFYADGSTPMSVEAISAAEATSVQEALTTSRAIRSYKWPTSVERDAQAGMEAGDQGYQIDTKVTYTYSGTAWLVSSPSDSGWILATLEGGWIASAPGEEPGYRKINGVLYLRGRTSNGSSGTGFTLPVGYRPAQIKRFSVASGATTTPALVIVNTNGTVVLVTGTQPNLSGISFPADA